METDELARLAALRRYRILDTDPERAFDDLTLLASHICGAPVALMSLVDSDRVWFKSRVGVEASETSRGFALCSRAIEQPDLFVVPDTRADPRFKDHPQVLAEPGIRFYAGAPLVTPDGHALGTLCVMDRVPRQLTEEQREALEALRRQAQVQLELRRNLAELAEALTERDRAEAGQARLVDELRASLDEVRKLSGLLPFCSTCRFNIVVPADPWAIPRVTEGLKKVLQEKGWSEDDAFTVEIALQEALANAIRHGCRNDPAKSVQCLVTFDSQGELLIVIRDPGPGFDPSTVSNPLEEVNLMKPGGRGIFLINELMNEVRFEDGGRQIRMRKRKTESGSG